MFRKRDFRNRDTASSSRRIRFLSAIDWQFDHEVRPFSDGAFDANLTAVGLDDILASRKSQAGTAFAGFIRSGFS